MRPTKHDALRGMPSTPYRAFLKSPLTWDPLLSSNVRLNRHYPNRIVTLIYFQRTSHHARSVWFLGAVLPRERVT
jgi:hypothetical protein